MNVTVAEKIIERLVTLGAKTFCLCPGGRNAPFVHVLARSQGLEVISFYDERSAGFFALGRARRDQRPVVVCTTSGTAVSELLSPVIEAFYSDTPVIALTADRPKTLRGTGAPQAIEQSHLFQGHVEKSWDFEVADMPFIEISGGKPVHINVCFDEPLLDSEVSNKTYSTARIDRLPRVNGDVEAAFTSLSKPLIVVGALSKPQSGQIANALSKLSVPVYAETLSGLRGRPEVSSQLLNSGDKLVAQMLKSGDVSSVVRLGDVPVGRYWRDLESLDIPVVSISDKDLPALSCSTHIKHSLEALSLLALHNKEWEWSAWRAKDQALTSQILSLFDSYPESEVALVANLSKEIPKGDQVYLGNSLPVRVWDLVDQSHEDVWASRGVNGIDGQLSTAMGLHQPKKNSWCILGDLTTLYDFSGFWLTQLLGKKSESFNLVVINNKGGQIFSRIFDDSLFLNSHDLNFSKLAEMWRWNYHNLTKPESLSEMQGLNLIEIQPDLEQTQFFWKEYDQLWQK